MIIGAGLLTPHTPVNPKNVTSPDNRVFLNLGANYPTERIFTVRRITRICFDRLGSYFTHMYPVGVKPLLRVEFSKWLPYALVRKITRICFDRLDSYFTYTCGLCIQPLLWMEFSRWPPFSKWLPRSLVRKITWICLDQLELYTLWVYLCCCWWNFQGGQQFQNGCWLHVFTVIYHIRLCYESLFSITWLVHCNI